MGKGNDHFWKHPHGWLGGLIFFVFIPKIGEMIQFDEHIFSDGLVKNHQLQGNPSYPPPPRPPPKATPQEIAGLINPLLLGG